MAKVSICRYIPLLAISWDSGIFPVLNLTTMYKRSKKQLRAELLHVNRELETAFTAFNSRKLTGSLLITGIDIRGKKFNEIIHISIKDPAVKQFFQLRADHLYARKLLLEHELASPEHSEADTLKAEVTP
jgi:hypothetical protein